jgi:phosphoglycolate phosphatase
MIKNILFDFDGTLVDTSEGIIKCFNYALNKLGFAEVEPSEIIKLIGLPLENMFVRLFDDNNPDLISSAVSYFRERYSTRGLLELNLYDGVEETLQYFWFHNIGLYIATSKPLAFTQTICNNLNINKYFHYITGVELSGISPSKTERIKCVLDKFSLKQIETVMVGDRAEDVISARDSFISSIGVLYGFGSKEELINAGCNWLVDNFRELKQIII